MKNLFPIIVILLCAAWAIYLLLIEPLIPDAWFI
jgi:hypothetical protein